MEDRKLDAAESLALIGRMIETTRSRMVRNAGRPFLAWGYATAATLIAVWAAVSCTGDARWNYLWFMLPLLGGAATDSTAADGAATGSAAADRPLNAAENIALVGRMIDNTRSRMVRNAGRPFLIWGYATVVTTLAVWAAYALFPGRNWYYLWLLLPVFGTALSLLTMPKADDGRVYTFIDRVIGQVWLVMGLTAWFVSLLSVFGDMPVPILFVILLMMGMGTAITGLVIRFVPAAVGGAAAIILAPVSLAATGYWVPALFIAGFVAMMIVPGHILNYKSNHPKQ